MPNQVLSWTNVLKDFPFTLALLWGTYLLLQLALDTPRSRKWPFYACLALDIFLVSLLRHNGRRARGGDDRSLHCAHRPAL